MNNKENDIIYNAEYIQQYITGKLTPKQMHALEKAALEDPFLAEAIEGYHEVNTSDWKIELNEIKNNFENRKSTGRIVEFSKPINLWWKSAAAVLLVVGIATLSYLFINKKENQQIAQQIPEIAKQADSVQPLINNPASETTPEKSDSEEKNNNKAGQKNLPQKENDFAAATENIKADSNFVYKPSVPPIIPPEKINKTDDSRDIATAKSKLEPIAANAAPVTVNNNNLNIEKGENKVSANESSIENELFDKEESLKQKKEIQLNRKFLAQVVGPDNTPLPFANISIKKENFGTYADVNGNFRLVSSDSILIVEVKSVGYQPKIITLQSSIPQNKIILSENNLAFTEKTIINKNSNTKSKLSRRATLLKDSVVNVEPADGWDNYNTYVTNNIEIPDDILKKNLHGQVELSFEVKPNGTITNIKVDKSLCNNCDEAAIRLIEQGPQWKVKNGKKGKGKVIVQF